jgi:site-specific DNA-methyltransferase (adenine-specific)
MGNRFQPGHSLGRFPANLIHDGSEEVLKLFPVDTSKKKFSITKRGPSKGYSGGLDQEDAGFSINRGDAGSAARFFYTAKASTSERDLGCYLLDEVENERTMGKDSRDRPTPKNRNIHPTVKPLSLTKYLATLLCPPKEGIILDPFMGSGTTALACELLNVHWIGIEREEYYCKIAKSRLRSTKEEKTISETINIDGEKLKIKQLTLFS